MSNNIMANSMLPAALIKTANNNNTKQALTNALLPVASVGASYGLWLGLGVILLVLVLLAIGDAWGLFRTSDASTDSPASVLVLPAQDDLLAKASTRAAREEGKKPEAWCFVGEDLEGRWCVQVPSRDACDSNRVFGSRSACELVTANALPSGVVNATATSMTPLSARPLAGR